MLDHGEGAWWGRGSGPVQTHPGSVQARSRPWAGLSERFVLLSFSFPASGWFLPRFGAAGRWEGPLLEQERQELGPSRV